MVKNSISNLIEKPKSTCKFIKPSYDYIKWRIFFPCELSFSFPLPVDHFLFIPTLFFLFIYIYKINVIFSKFKFKKKMLIFRFRQKRKIKFYFLFFKYNKLLFPPICYHIISTPICISRSSILTSLSI